MGLMIFSSLVYLIVGLNQPMLSSVLLSVSVCGYLSFSMFPALKSSGSLDSVVFAIDSFDSKLISVCVRLGQFKCCTHSSSFSLVTMDINHLLPLATRIHC